MTDTGSTLIVTLPRALSERLLNELTISNAAYLSAWNGSRPITLPMDEAAFDEKLAALAAGSHEKQTGGTKKYNTEYQDRWQINW